MKKRNEKNISTIDDKRMKRWNILTLPNKVLGVQNPLMDRVKVFDPSTRVYCNHDFSNTRVRPFHSMSLFDLV